MSCKEEASGIQLEGVTQGLPSHYHRETHSWWKLTGLYAKMLYSTNQYAILTSTWCLFSSRWIGNLSSDDLVLVRSSDAGMYSGQNGYDQIIPSDSSRSVVSASVEVMLNSSLQQAGNYFASFFGRAQDGR